MIGSDWQQAALDSAPVLRWKNGGGTTRELLALPSASHWAVRVSVADVASDGPFSSFPDVRRWFAVLAGGGVRLSVDGRAVDLDHASPPFEFDGGSHIDCRLIAGPTIDFNLMVRGRRARLRRFRGSIEVGDGRATLLGLYAHDHAMRLAGPTRQFEVPPRTLAWRCPPGTADAVHAECPEALLLEVYE